MNNWRSIHQHLLTLRHRQLVLLVGDDEWALDELNKQLNACTFLEKNVVIYDEKKFFVKPQNAVVDNKNYHHYLGQEFQQFIYCGKEIIPDIFAAMTGTVVAGGFIFLVMNEPQLTKLLANYENLYFQRFYQFLKADESVKIVSQHQDVDLESFVKKSDQNSTEVKDLSLISCSGFDDHTVANKQAVSLRYQSITKQQEAAVEAIIHVAKGHRNRPVVLTADRGRGKSAALALACIHLLKTQQHSLNIVIVAPKLSALTSFFSQFSTFLPEAVIEKSSVNYQGSRVQFLPIDVVLAQKPKVNLLIIDEAASLPLYLLTALFVFYHRLVFSSTLHGYEGAGRGFAIKFNDILTSNNQQAKAVSLSEPIRWAKTDPVEQTILNTCLLNAELPEINHQNICHNTLTYCVLNKVELLGNEKLLRDIFAILVTAHYQTTPNDLKLMLDNPAVSVVVLFSQSEVPENEESGKEVIAVSLIITEGGLPENIAKELDKGQRRIRDHFIPQALLTHAGFSCAFNYLYWRVMRIAVHPQLQQKGIGQYFLTQIEQAAINKQVDILAASFALNEPLLNFWQKQSWQMARIGFQADHASGEYSAILLKALNHQSSLFCGQVVSQFYRGFTFLLTNHYEKLSTELIQKVFSVMPEICKPVLSDFDLKAVVDFAEGYRLFDNCSYSLSLWLLHVCSSKHHSLLLPLTARLIQKHSIEKICLAYQFSGKKRFQLECRKRVKTVLER